MRAKTGTDTAMTADYRFSCFFIKVDRAHDACRFAKTTPNAFIGYKQYAAAVSFFKGVAGAYFHAGRFFASEAYDGDKAA